MGSFKLGKMTLRSLFGKPETILYPVETKPAPPGLKGQIGIDMDACILCGICERTCPAGALSVSKDDDSWSIDRFRCVQCGACTRACPKECLTMLPDYQKPAVGMFVDTVVKQAPSEEEIAAKEAKKKAKLEAAMKARERAKDNE